MADLAADTTEPRPFLFLEQIERIERDRAPLVDEPHCPAWPT